MRAVLYADPVAIHAYILIVFVISNVMVIAAGRRAYEESVLFPRWVERSIS